MAPMVSTAIGTKYDCVSGAYLAVFLSAAASAAAPLLFIIMFANVVVSRQKNTYLLYVFIAYLVSAVIKSFSS